MKEKKILVDSFQVTPEGVFVPRESHSISQLLDVVAEWKFDINEGNLYVNKKKRACLFALHKMLYTLCYPATYQPDKIVKEE